MPLHDWNEPRGWDGVHHTWITELLRWVKPHLPPGYRAYIGSVPTLSIGAVEKPDVSIRQWTEVNPAVSALGNEDAATGEEPDEQVAVLTLDAEKAVHISLHGLLIAAIELISPRNKDRIDSKTTYLMRYLAYLHQGVHLLLVDVHRRPLQFSFADRIAEELGIRQPPLPPPMAVSYCVGNPAATGGRNLGIWRRPLTVGAPLPIMRLALDVGVNVPVELEQTYMHAAADAYLT